jgi:hypothetical protein
VCCCALFATDAVAQDKGTEWDVPPSVSADDRRDLLEFAKRLGIADVQRVTAQTGFVNCLTVLIESRPVVEGRRVRSAWSLARQFEGPGCSSPSGDRPSLRVGNWITGLPVAQQWEQWRIHDEGWFIDVNLGPAVGYDAAERIIRTARQKRFVEQCAGDRPGAHDVDDIVDILATEEVVLAEERLADPRKGDYVISATRGSGRGVSGIVVHVRVSAGDVILVGCSSWLG